MKNFSKKQKSIIVTLLLIIILFLIIAFFSIKNNNDGLTNDGSRTIMIYVDGSNLESESGIITNDINSINPQNIDLEHTHILLYTGGTEEWHNFISNKENAIYELTTNGFVKIESYEQKNMGDPNTLSQFLRYGYENYKSYYYDVVFYNHGGAIDGAIYDDFTGDHLTLKDLNLALKDSPFGESNKLDTVLFRTCLNGTLEVASVFSPYANYLIASEEVTHGSSRSSILNYLNNIDTYDTGVDYGNKFINAYKEQMKKIDAYGLSTTSMYSIIDLSKIDEIIELLDSFIIGIDLDKSYKDIARMRSNMYQYAYTSYDISDYDMVDLYSLVFNLKDYSSVDSAKLLGKISDAIIYNWSEEKNSHGLSIYFPYNGSKKVKSYFLETYDTINYSNSYYSFIEKFNSYNTSNKDTAFSAFSIKNNETSISDNKEFTLQLNKQQLADYNQAIYIIFNKTDDGLFQPIYSSDNISVDENGLLKTNVSNNLIKIYNNNYSDDDGGFLTIIERNQSSKKNVFTSALLFEPEEFSLSYVNAYFDVSGNIPQIINYISNDSQNGTSGTVYKQEDISKYVIQFLATRYNILDNNNNYTTDWDNNGYTYYYEVEPNNFRLENWSLDGNGEYYCVFKIADVYGNIYYSNLLSIN